jgi:hypothetical protein
MKKLYTTLVAVLAIAHFSYAQWTGGPTGPIYYNGGSVGIGINNPQVNLEINNGSYSNGNQLMVSGAEKARYNGLISETVLAGSTIFSLGTTSNFNSFAQTLNIYNGNVGIGTTNPVSALNVVRGGTNATNDYSSIHITTTGSGSIYGPILYLNGISGTAGRMWGLVSSGQSDAGATGAAGNFAIYDASAGVSRLIINSSGYVGIGTTIPKEALSVNGNIRSKEIKVETANWPDYVFKPQYVLPSLLEVKKYIDQNHHLPEIPSEAEVIKNGVNLGEMVKLQTKKIEELTLYLIEKDKQVSEQRALLVDQQKQIADQSKWLTEQQKVNQSLQQQINQLAKKINN